MHNNKFKGTGVALITPFDDNNKVDVDALKKIVKYQIDNNIDYFVVMGTTAESATLNEQEKTLVKETIIEVNSGKLPLVLGMGSNSTQDLVEEISKTDLTDFDAILSVSPYYNKPTQNGIYEHFKAISEISEKPIILYNVPGRTASNMTVETVVRLAEDFENIIGIKEASGNILQAYELIQKAPKEFLVISGDDMITLPMVLGGGAGVISVIGQGFPKAFSAMVRLGLSGQSQDAFKIFHRIAPAIDMIFEQGNPAGIKSVFKHMKLSSDRLRLPLVKVDENLDNRLGKFIKGFDRNVE